jgi:aminoglycoside phosphotransferase (APT) family kinase protein
MTVSSDIEPVDAGLEKELRRFVDNRRRMFYLKTDIPGPDRWLRQFTPGQAGDVGFTFDEVAVACRSALNRLPRSMAPLKQQGTFHRLLRVDLGDEELIMRINRLSHLFRDFQLWVTRWISRTLRDCDLPCVDVLAADATRQHVPFDFEILRPARGQCLRELDDDEPRMLAELASLGETIARLHRICTTGFGWLDPSPLVLGEPYHQGRGLMDRWSDYVLLNLDTHLRHCVDGGDFGLDTARRIEVYFETLEPLLRNAPAALLHGDLGSHNVFTDGRQITELIDWEDCLSGDPVFEVAFWATFHPPRRHSTFLQSYRQVAAGADDFLVRFWLYFLRISLSKAVHRRRFGYEDQPGRRPANQRIHDALEGLEAALAGKGGDR